MSDDIEEAENQFELLVANGVDEQSAAKTVISCVFEAMRRGELPDLGDFKGVASALNRLGSDGYREDDYPGYSQKEKEDIKVNYGLYHAQMALNGIVNSAGGQKGSTAKRSSAGVSSVFDTGAGPRNYLIAFHYWINGMTQSKLAEKYDLSTVSISKILKPYKSYKTLHKHWAEQYPHMKRKPKT